MKRGFLLLMISLTSLLMTQEVFGQYVITHTAPPPNDINNSVVVCGTNVSTFTVNVAGPPGRTTLTLDNLPPGFEINVPGGSPSGFSSGPVTVNINVPGSINFTGRANCQIINYFNGGGLMTFDATVGTTTYTTSPDFNNSLMFANLRIYNPVQDNYSGNLGETFTRSVTIQQNGRFAYVEPLDVVVNRGGGLTVNSVTLINGGNTRSVSVANGVVTLTSADFAALGFANGRFNHGDEFIWEENITINSCNDLGSTIRTEWGCDGATCEVEPSASGFPLNVALIDATSGPSFTTDISFNYPTCITDPIVYTYRIENTGSAYVDDIEFTIDAVASSIDIDPNSLQFRTGGSGSYTSIAATGSSGGGGCGGPGNVDQVTTAILDTRFEPGEIIEIQYTGIHCCEEGCGNSQTLFGTSVVADYVRQCTPTGSTSASSTNLNTATTGFSEAPAMMQDGDTDVWKYTITSIPIADYYQMRGTNRMFCVELVVHRDLVLDGAITWYNNDENDSLVASGVTRIPHPTLPNYDILNACFPDGNAGFMSSQADYPFSHIDVPLRYACSGSFCSDFIVNTDFELYWNYNCGTPCHMNVLCETNPTLLDGNCCPGPGTCRGLSTGRVTFVRSCYGDPDNDQDGCPDASGTLDFNNIRTDRGMVGDDIQYTIDGAVSLGGGPTIPYVFMNLEFPTPLVVPSGPSTLTITRGATTFTCNNITGIRSTDGLNLLYFLDTASIQGCGTIPADFNYEDGDQLLLVGNIAVDANIGCTIEQQFIWGEYFGSDVANPLAGDTLSCDTRVANTFSIVGYSWDITAGALNEIACGFDAGISLNTCIGGVSGAGGNFFPYEYRQIFEPINYKIVMPNGYAYNQTTTSHTRTISTGTEDNITENYVGSEHIVIGDTIVGTYTDFMSICNGTTLNYSDEGWSMNHTFNFVSGCAITPMTLPTYREATIRLNTCSGNMDDLFIQRSFANDITPSGTDLSLTASNDFDQPTDPNLNWTMTLQDLNGIGANNAWFMFISPNNNIQVNSLNGPGTITNVNEIYQLGNIPAGARNYTINASYNTCDFDSLMVVVGFECSGYPASPIDVLAGGWGCALDTLWLRMLPQIGEIQQFVADLPIDSINLCDPFRYEIHVDNVGDEVLFSPLMEVFMPYSGGATMVINSEQACYPCDVSDFGTPGNPSTTANYFSIADATQLDYTPLGIRYSWNMDTISALFAANGWPGVDEPDVTLRNFRVSFMVETNCDFNGSDFLRFRATGHSSCGYPTRSGYRNGGALNVRGSSVEYHSITNIETPDPMDACGTDSHQISGSIMFLGQTNGADTVRVALTNALRYVPGSISFANPAHAVNLEPRIDTIGPGGTLGFQELNWNIASDIPAFTQIDFTFDVTLDPDGVLCNDNQIVIIDAVAPDEVFCVGSGDSCSIAMRSGTNDFEILFLVKNEAEITALYSSDCESDTLIIDDVAITNTGLFDIVRPITVSFYQDSDGSGNYSSGDFFIGDLTHTASIPTGGVSHISGGFPLDPTNGCAIIALADGCMCNVAEIVNYNITPNNAGPDTAICNNAPLTMGCGFNHPAMTYRWTAMTPAPISAISDINDPGATFQFNNPGATDVVFTYVLSTQNGACLAFDTVTIIVHPTVVGVGRDLLTCPAKDVFMEGPTGFSGYVWSAPIASYMPYLEDPNDPNTRVFTTGPNAFVGGPMTYTLTYIDSNGCQQVFEQTVSEAANCIDLELEKQQNPTGVTTAGSIVTYTLIVRNTLDRLAAGIEVTDLLPAGVSFVSTNPAGAAYDPVTGIWNIPFLFPGDSAVLEIDGELVCESPVCNIAEITGLGDGYADIDSEPNNGDSSEDDYGEVCIVVNDVTPPSISCPSDIQVNNDPGNCNAFVNVPLPDYLDACDTINSVIQNDFNAGTNADGTYPLGTTVVTYTVSDASGNSAQCSVNVTVVDAENPVINCPADVSVRNENGLCEATYTYIAPVGNDNCPGHSTSFTSGLGSGSVFTVGSHVETFTVVDAAGNSTECSFTIEVEDLERPSITCPQSFFHTEILFNESDPCNPIVTYELPTLADNCGVSTYSLVTGLPSGSNFGSGTHILEYIVYDAEGNATNCQFGIVVACLTVINIGDTVWHDLNRDGLQNNNEPGIEGVTVSLYDAATSTIIATTTTDANGYYEFLQVSPGDYQVFFNISTNTEGQTSYVVTDQNNPGNNPSDRIDSDSDIDNNEQTNVFTIDGAQIALGDNWTIDAGYYLLPIISYCPPSIVIENDLDICGAVTTYIQPDLVLNPVTGAGIDSLNALGYGDVFPVGTTTQNYIAQDLSGNTTFRVSDYSVSTLECQFTVTVLDTQDPYLTCPDNVDVENDLDRCGAVVNYAPTMWDNCPNATVVQTSPAALVSGSEFPVGTTDVIYTATDEAGNVTTCQFSILVRDTQDPYLTCPANMIVPNDPGECGAVISYSPQYWDNCAILSVVEQVITASGCPMTAGGFFPLGTTTVNFTATDIYNNQTSCTFTVEIQDQEAPTINCPSNITANNDAGLCSAVTNYPAPTGFDNCDNNVDQSQTISAATMSGFILAQSFTSGLDGDLTQIDVDIVNPTNVGNIRLRIYQGDGMIGTPLHDQNIPVSGIVSGINNLMLYTPLTLCVGQQYTFALNYSNGSQVRLRTCTSNCYAGGRLISFSSRDLYFQTHVGQGNPINITQTDGTGLTSGDAFPVGTTNLEYTISDGVGNQALCSFSVTIFDTEDPTINCPSNIIINNDAGNCDAVVNYTPPVGNDNCPGEATVISGGLPSGSNFPVGTTQVSFTVTDAAGYQATCGFEVTVNDTENPTINCPSNINVSNDAGNCDAVVNYTPPVGNDNCPGQATTISGGLPSGSIFPLGTTQVVYTVTDAAGNQASCGFEVTVNDTENPTINCPSNIVVSNDAGNCDAVVNFTPPVGNDNCPGEATVISGGLPSGSNFPVGTTQVSFTVTDAAGNQATCGFEVTVNDTEDPTINCPSNIVVSNDAGNCDAVVNFTPPVGNDNCPGEATVISGGLPSGSTFPLGTTQVVYTVTDAAGNQATCGFEVTVNDTENPTINCPSNINVNNDSGNCDAVVNFTPPTGNDNCPGSATVISGGLPSGSNFPVGTTQVVYTVTDAAGNQATCGFEVTVNDTENPTINCPSNINVNNDAGNCSAVVTYPSPVLGSDNCPGENTNLTVGLASGSIFPLGTTQVVYMVTDAAGQTAQCQFEVTINDTEAPAINCLGNINTSNDGGSCDAVVNYIPPAAADNCPGVSTTISGGLPSGSTFPLGTTQVIFTATDAAGNQSTCGFDVTVTDEEDPRFVGTGANGSAINCPADATVCNDLGQPTAMVTYQTPYGVDNCPNPTTTQTGGLPSGSAFPTGCTDNCFVVTDAVGNTAECCFEICVKEPASLGDYVWNDVDGDGQQESGEAPIANVVVELFDGSGNPLGTTMTDANGYYIFDNLPPGDYYVVFNGPTGFIPTAQDNGADNSDSDADPITGQSHTTTLTAGEHDPTIDAGFFLPASLGDTVWYDYNANGIQDPSETPIQNVVVELFDANSGLSLGTTQTDANGYYIFDNLPSGDYYVVFDHSTAPNGYIPTQANQGLDTDDSDADETTGQSHTTNLSPGEHDPTIDAGYYLPASLGDYVWHDLDADGEQEAGEPGIVGVVVELWDATTSSLIGTTATDGSGYYEFDNLPPGDYYVSFNGPTGFIPTAQDNAADNSDSDADPITGDSQTITLNPGDHNPTLDAGFFQYASLGDTVWHDVNANGQQDGTEAGIQGVVITLYDANSGLPLATTATDANGYYIFDNLMPGDYYVIFDHSTAPSHLHPTVSNSGVDASDSDADETTGQSHTVSLQSGEHDPTIDAGYFEDGILGDYVWHDLDADGEQETGEPGIPGVVVELWDATTSTLLGTTATDGTGYYGFDNLPPGDYYVVFDHSTVPSGMLPSPQDNAGDGVDSDADPITGQTGTYTLPIGGSIPTIDAGFYFPASLGDYVWHDVDADGEQEAGEPGIQGVVVELFDGSGNSIGTTSTDATGYYHFGNLTPGDYYVVFDHSTVPSGLIPTSQDNAADNSDSDADPITGQSHTTTLSSNEHDPTIDAGYFAPASLGDYVWNDVDGDGQQEAGEPPIAGVIVELFDGAGNSLGTTATDGTGYYIFDNLPPGDYYVEFTSPPGFIPTAQDNGADNSDSDADPITGQTQTVTLAPGDHNPTLDAGFFNPASLGDYVWYDTDNDGLQEAGEPGIQGVIVELFDGAGNSLGTTATDANGYYLFDELPAGDYYVVFDHSTAPTNYLPTAQDNAPDGSDSDANPTTGQSQTVTLAPGDHNPTIDAGYYLPASLGDYVWHDLDVDGQQDAGEPGIQGVTVELFDGLGNSLGTTSTDATGFYEFTELAPGDYYVVFDHSTAPNGFVPTDSNQGNDASDSDADETTGQSHTVTLAPGDNDPTIDAGYYQPASLGDYVWNDIDGDGQQEAGEPPISGVIVELFDGLGNSLGTTATDGTGYYIFDNLPPGDYYVEFSTPPGFIPTAQDNGADNSDSDADPITGQSQTVTLTEGEHNPTIDAGFFNPASLGDYVWHDVDNDGLQEAGENPIQGVIVELFDGLGNSLGTTATDVNGYYIFDELPAGDYYVIFDHNTAPSGYVPTVQDNAPDGSDSDADPVTGQSQTVTLNPGDHNPTLDAGYFLPASLGDYVWEDTDGDGQQDPSENGIPGVTVTLYDAITSTVIGTTTTGPNGEYLFDNLPPGDYVVGFTAPPGYIPTSQDNAPDGSDSDADPFTGLTPPVTLSPGEHNPTIDAGFYLPASLGDYVWEDTDADGAQEAGEPGIAGVTVTLYDANSGLPLGTTATDVNGYYLFDNLPTGDYYVVFDHSTAPSGFLPTSQDNAADNSDSDADPITGQSQTVHLNPGDHNPTIDAGYTPPVSSIGDYVWEDDNADGQQDPGENGIPGVVVELWDATTSTLIGTTLTDGNGGYLFDNLPPGDYYVVFGNPPGMIPSPSNQGPDGTDSDAGPGGTTGTYTLPPNGHIPTVDAGFYFPASLGDTVWFDANYNGQQDASEAPIQGVVVELFDGAGNTLATTATDANGYYHFGGLTPGDYYVVFDHSTVPNGWLPTLHNQGNDASDSDADPTTGQSHTTTLGSGDHDPTLDAGYYPPASVGNYVWEDTDGDGEQDPSENPIPGVIVTLYDATTSTIIGTTTTDPNGEYLFDNLPPGDYVIEFTPPPGYIPTSQDNAPDNSDSDINPFGETPPITLGPGEHNPTIDAGFIIPASLGDYVWEDTDGDGAQEAGEPPIPGVVVELYDATTSTLLGTTVTDGTGYYIFDDLTPGDYYVVFNTPTGYLPTAQDNAADNSDSDADPITGESQTVTLTSGEHNPTIDAGFTAPVSSIGDFVWEDEDADGQQDPGENGIPGVVVELWDATTSTLVGTTLTDGSGGYLFDNLPPGDYYVNFGTPPGMIPSPSNQGPDGTDSDAGPGGTTGTYTLPPNGHIPTVDAGFYYPASLGDTVWFDANINGQQDAGEPGIQGVIVELFDGAGNALATTATDANGYYHFGGLTPGDYYVVFDHNTVPNGWLPTLHNQGNDASDSDADPTTGQSHTTTLGSGDHDPTIDAGYHPLGSIGNYVWEDTDGDGEQDPSESGIPGVVVTLYDATTSTIIGTTTTGPNGEYLFDNLPPGDYVLEFTPPPGYIPTVTDNAPDNSDSDINPFGQTPPVTLGPGEHNPTIDAGFIIPASLGDYVWYDYNGDGVQDATETPMDSVLVTLYDADSGLPIGTTMTDATGWYEFDNLTPGNYYLVFNNSTAGSQSHLIPTQPNETGDANDSDADATGQTGTYTLSSGEHNPTIDAGYFEPAAIGSYAWIDDDKDGQFDPEENGVGGIVVTLYNAENEIVGTTVTDSTGYWYFFNLFPGDYHVHFDISTAPSGYGPTNPNIGDDNSDSDMDPVTGMTGVYSLIPGDNNPSVGAGFIQGAFLPVEFISIDVQKVGEEVYVNWKTANEFNSSHFEIERVKDPITGTPEFLGRVQAAGYSVTPRDYQFIDADPMTNESYYRLIQADQNGDRVNSSWFRVDFNIFGTPFKAYAYPNPATTILNLGLVGQSGTATVMMYNGEGKVVYANQYDLIDESLFNTQIDVANMAQGVYTLKVVNGEDMSFHKIILTR